MPGDRTSTEPLGSGFPDSAHGHINGPYAMGGYWPDFAYTAFDTLRNRSASTAHGNATTTNGPGRIHAGFGPAISLVSGSSQEIQLPAGWLNDETAGTLALLVKVVTGATTYLIEESSAGADQFRLRVVSNGTLTLLIDDGTSTSLSSAAGAFGFDGWRTISAEWGPNGMKLFIDGLQVASNSDARQMASTLDVLRIGRSLRAAAYSTMYFGKVLAWKNNIGANANWWLNRLLRSSMP